MPEGSNLIHSKFLLKNQQRLYGLSLCCHFKIFSLFLTFDIWITRCQVIWTPWVHLVWNSDSSTKMPIASSVLSSPPGTSIIWMCTWYCSRNLLASHFLDFLLFGLGAFHDPSWSLVSSPASTNLLIPSSLFLISVLYSSTLVLFCIFFCSSSYWVLPSPVSILQSLL